MKSVKIGFAFTDHLIGLNAAFEQKIYTLTRGSIFGVWMIHVLVKVKTTSKKKSMKEGSGHACKFEQNETSLNNKKKLLKLPRNDFR